MGELKTREEPGFRDAGRLLADSAAGSIRGPTLQDLKGVIERNFGGTPFATLGQFTANAVGIVAGNIDRTLGVSSFFGEPAYRPHATIINDITKSALASAQQGQIEKARESIKEADEKLAYAMEMKKREKELDESEKTEKGKEEGAKEDSKNDDVKEALHAVFSDVGTVNAERAEMAGQAAEFYADNRGVLGLPEMKGQEKAVLGFIASLGKDAKAKVRFDKEEKGAEFEQIRGMVAPIVKQKLDSALAGVSDAAESAIRMLDQKGISKEFKKALEGIRDLSKDVRSQLKEGKLVSDEQLRNVDRAISYAKGAYANLSMIGEKLRGPASEIFARAIKAIEGGDEKAAGVQDFIAREYAGAGAKARETLGTISASLESGKMKASEAIGGAAKYISGILRGNAEGIKDAGILGSLNRIFGRLEGGSATVEDLGGAKAASVQATEYKEAIRGLEKNKKAQDGVTGIFRRAFSSTANGLLSLASKQGALAKLFGKKRMSGVRDQIESVSKNADTAGKLKRMHELVRQGMKPEEAALLCSDGEEGILEKYNAMDDPEKELQAAEQQLDIFIFAAEARSEFAKNLNGDGGDICKAAVEWLDERIIAKVARGEEPSADDVRTLFALIAMHEGSAEGMERFLLDDPSLSGLMSGTLGFQETLDGLHGEDAAAVQDMLWSAQQALLEGRYAEAAGHMLAANAAAELKGKDRDMLEKLSYAVACEGSESAQTLMWIGRAQLDRAALGEEARTRSGAYFDIAILAYGKGDFNGAQVALSLAKLHGRAGGVGSSDPRAQEATSIVREVLGDYRDLNGRLLFGDGSIKGLAGGDASLLEGLESATAGGETVTGWLSRFSGETKLVALALRVEKADIDLGRAEMGSMLLEASDPKFQDIYQGQEDRYLDKAVLAEKTGKKEKARGLREEAERTARARELMKETAMAYEIGAGMREQEIDRILGELEKGGEPAATGAYGDGAIICSLAEEGMVAASAYHESVVNVRTDDKEEGRKELFRASESYLKAATTLGDTGFIDKSLIARAKGDLGAGLAGLARQKSIQKTTKQIEQKLLGMITECREENDANQAEFAKDGSDTPKYAIYYDDGLVPAMAGGALIDHEDRAKELDLAEDDAKRHRFGQSMEHINLAKAGITIDRFRCTVEREYRRLYPEMQGGHWSEEAFGIMDVMKEFGYAGMMTDLFNADRLIGKGDLEGAGGLVEGFDTRLAVNITAQQLALQEYSLKGVSSGLGEIANAAGGFGLDPEIVKESGIDFSTGARAGFSKMGKFMLFKRISNPFMGDAHSENVDAVRATAGAYAISDKAAKLKKKADTTISLLRRERDALREREKAGDGQAALADAGERLEKLAVSGEKISKKYGRFNDGFQIWASCASQMLTTLDGVDSIEKTRGYESASQLRYEQMRDDAAMLGQLASIASSNPEKVVNLITSGESVSWRMGTGEYKLRDEHGGYAAATLKFSSRSGSFAELFEEATERSLHVAEGMSEGNFGDRGRAAGVAKAFTTLVLANSGIVKSGTQYKKVKMSAAERGLAALALNGSGGGNEMISLFLSSPGTLTSFFSTDEGGDALSAIGSGIGEKAEIVGEIASSRMRGAPIDSEALEGYKHRLDESGNETKREYDAFIKEGLSDESTARGVKAVLELGASAALTASGFGSVAGVYGGTMALKDLAFQSDRAGGFDNLSTFDQVMGVTNVTLGFADGATSFLGEIGKGASEASHGLSLARGGFGGSRLERAAMSFMAGGNAATWTGRILGTASLATSGISMYQAVGSFREGGMNWFEFGVTMLSGMQPIADHGSAALGKKGLARLADDTGRTGFKKIAATTARGFIGILSGNLVKGDVESYGIVERMEEHGAAFRKLDETQQAEYAKAVGLLERVIGRTMDHEEGLFAMSFIRDGGDAGSAALAFIATPKAQHMFELHLRRNAGEEVDMSNLPSDDAAFLGSLRGEDKNTAHDRIQARELSKARDAVSALRLGDISIEVSKSGKMDSEAYVRVAELAEALQLFKDGKLSQAAKARLGIDDAEGSQLGLLKDAPLEKVGEIFGRLALLKGGEGSARAIEAAVGRRRGSPELEAELRPQDSRAMGRKEKPGWEILRIARTLEWAAGQQDLNASMADPLKEALAKSPEYAGAIKTACGAREDERPKVIVQEAEAIAYSRKQKEIDAAIEEAGLDEEGSRIAKAIHKSLNGEPVKADLALLDASVMEEVQGSVDAGMEEADAIVEAVSGLIGKKGEGADRGLKIRDSNELNAIYKSVQDDTQRMVEDEIGDTPGSPELEAELARHESASSGKGEGRASQETVIIARVLERMLGQIGGEGAPARENSGGFSSEYPDYASALKNLESARPDELPGLIRQEAMAIANSRKLLGMEDAIEAAQLDEKTADLARAIFKSIIGEPVRADLSYLDQSVMERAEKAAASGMDEADAAVETALSIMGAGEKETGGIEAPGHEPESEGSGKADEKNDAAADEGVWKEIEGIRSGIGQARKAGGLENTVRLGELGEAFILLKGGKLTSEEKTRLGIGDTELRAMSRMTKAGKDEAIRLLRESGLSGEKIEEMGKRMEGEAETGAEASAEHVVAALCSLARWKGEGSGQKPQEGSSGPGAENAEALQPAEGKGGSGDGQKIIQRENIELRRAVKAVEELDKKPDALKPDAEISDIDSKRKKDDQDPEPPDLPEADAKALERTGTDDRVELVGTQADDGAIEKGAIIMGPSKWFAKDGGPKARQQATQEAGPGLDSSAAYDGAAGDGSGSERMGALLAPSEVSLPGVLKDGRAEKAKDEYYFESKDGKSLRVRDAPQARLVEHIGSGAGCEVYFGQMVVDGQPKDVAVKILQVSKEDGKDNLSWNQRMDKAKKELELLKIGSGLGIGPSPLGFVEVGGNPAIAMELVRGKPLEDMDAGEIRKYVSDKTFGSLDEMYWKMRNGGFMLDDFQFLVLTGDQRLGGVDRKKGEVVLIDLESLTTLDKSNRFETFKDRTIEEEASNAKKAVAFAFFSEYYDSLASADAKLKADLDSVLVGIYGRKKMAPDLIARISKMEIGKRTELVEAYLSGMADKKESARLRGAMEKAGRESGVQLLSGIEAPAAQQPQALENGAELARRVRNAILGKADLQSVANALPEIGKKAAGMLAMDATFILNAKGDDRTFERFIGNKRTGARLIEEIIAKAKKAGESKPE